MKYANAHPLIAQNLLFFLCQTEIPDRVFLKFNSKCKLCLRNMLRSVFLQDDRISDAHIETNQKRRRHHLDRITQRLNYSSVMLFAVDSLISDQITLSTDEMDNFFVLPGSCNAIFSPKQSLPLPQALDIAIVCGEFFQVQSSGVSIIICTGGQEKF